MKKKRIFEPRKCRRCNIEFRPIRANQKYCGKKCRLEAIKLTHKGVDYFEGEVWTLSKSFRWVKVVR